MKIMDMEMKIMENYDLEEMAPSLSVLIGRGFFIFLVDNGLSVKVKSLLNDVPIVFCVAHVPTRPAFPTCPTRPEGTLSVLQLDFINIIAPESNVCSTFIYTPSCILFFSIAGCYT